jgi:hypothetical protein
VVILSGCHRAPPTAELSGKISFNGSPLQSGQITVTSDDGRGASVAIKDGSYKMPNAPTGHVKISITGSTDATTEGKAGAPAPAAGMMEAARARSKNPDIPVPSNRKPVLIPTRYGYDNSSGLETTIQKGKKNEFSTDLTP